MLNPFFSVLTVVRNNATGLQETAKSVSKQNSELFEWIVVDGKSTDNTLEVADSYLHLIKTLVSEKDNGIYDAMNKAIRLASGEFLIFMNAGDCFASPNVLDLVQRAILENPQPPDLVMGNALLQFPSGLQRLHKPRRKDYIRHSIIANHQATIIRTNLHRKYMHDQTMRICSDYLTTAQMIHSGAELLFIDTTIAIRDSSPASAALSSGWVHIRECAQVQRSVFGMSSFSICKSASIRIVKKKIMFLVAKSKQGSLLHGLFRALHRDQQSSTSDN